MTAPLPDRAARRRPIGPSHMAGPAGGGHPRRMARILFGTDGVRGVAGEKLTADLALSLGRAVTHLSPARAPRMLIIRDTRESGEMLETALAAGVAAAGGEAWLGGVMPTPAAALAVQRDGYDLAAVISASHNPYRDNGIKFFGPDGDKLSDADEEAIERRLGATSSAHDDIGRVRPAAGMLGDYLDALRARFGGLDLTGLRVLLDCANGATFQAGPAIFRELGATVSVLADQPDGRNINDGCGSTHPELLSERMRAGHHDIGFAFDGDGDRLIAVDRTGQTLDGDELVALAALHLRDAGRLPGNGVAMTVMTNFAFHQAMRDAGIDVTTTKVGDRYVLAGLREEGYALGGEQSGHIIELGFAPSGDGIAAALLTLEALGGRDLATSRVFEKLPQELINVPVRGAAASVAAARPVQDAVVAVTGRLAASGRVLVRPSGTEPLVRVMAEAPSSQLAAAACRQIAEAVRAAA
ncbi:MAG: phosphoglucosamine mutase [Solirubrobacteraceae bacterium]|nr:phosphoglucosamine mutase [Solirubrobacteraceae bacterium]